MPFTCSCCGEEHDGLPEPSYQRPDEVWNLRAAQMRKRVEGNSDWCVLRGETAQAPSRFFLRGIIPIPIRGVADDDWAIGAWVEVSEPDFGRYMARYDEDGSDEPRFAGRIANAVKTFEAALGAEVWVQLGPEDQRPTLWFEGESDQELARVQADGVDMARIHAIFGHFH